MKRKRGENLTGVPTVQGGSGEHGMQQTHTRMPVCPRGHEGTGEPGRTAQGEYRNAGYGGAEEYCSQSMQPTEGQLMKEIKQAYAADPMFATEKCAGSYCKDTSGMWLMRDKVVVPSVPELKKRLLWLCHDALMSGHPGVEKTLHLAARQFYWPGMLAEVEQYVHHCESCQRNKASTKSVQASCSHSPFLEGDGRV